MDGVADMDFDPDDLKEDFRMKLSELQWDLKGLGCDLSDFSDFLKETRALVPAEQIPKLRMVSAPTFLT
jgi:hypothetical protein